ncbi:hypothetical protein AKJ16_DCAP13060 [Drosera capensis]
MKIEVTMIFIISERPRTMTGGDFSHIQLALGSILNLIVFKDLSGLALSHQKFDVDIEMLFGTPMLSLQVLKTVSAPRMKEFRHHAYSSGSSAHDGSILLPIYASSGKSVDRISKTAMSLAACFWDRRFCSNVR